jgi:AcrR family transcriptional regulator
MTETSEDISNRTGGPLRRPVSDAIVQAARQELAEQGFGRFSVETVARRAGVGKGALYRRWVSKEALLLWLLQGNALDYVRVPDAGSLAGDLEAYIATAAEILSDSETARIAAHLYAELSTESALAKLIRDTVQPIKNAAVQEIFDRAVARGEVAQGFDRSLAQDLLMGPLYWRLVVLRGGLEVSEVVRLARMIKAAIQADPNERREPAITNQTTS